LPPPPLPPSTDPWGVDDQQNEFYSQVPGSQNQQQNAYPHQQASTYTKKINKYTIHCG